MSKIIFINRYFHPDNSATSQILSDLAFDMAARGMNIHVITSSQRYDDPDAGLPMSESVGGVEIHRVKTTRFGRTRLLGRAVDYLTFYISAVAKVWQLAGPGDLVIAKTDPPLISVVVFPIVFVRGAVLLNWLQDVFPEVAAALDVRGASGLVARILRSLRNFSLRKAELNIVLGHRMADHLERQGIDRDKIRIIHNFSSDEDFHPVPAGENPLRRQWGLDGKFVVGYSGNMGRAHEFGTILDAAQSLNEEREIVFLFIGGGPQLDWIKREVTRRQLGNAMFQPYQPREVLRYSLTAADLHLISLRPVLEGLIVPSKFYGICAAGRPTLFIGDRSGEVPLLVERFKCGLSVSEGDAGALVEAILSLRQHPEKRDQMGLNGRKGLDEQFSRKAALDTWASLLGVRSHLHTKNHELS